MYAKTLRRYLSAADQGDRDAQFKIGKTYYDGDGVAKDRAAAMRWFLKAAEQGDRDAQFMIGLGYYDGDGVAKDVAKAMQWFMKSATQGERNAQRAIGIGLYYGIGVPQNIHEGTDWLAKAGSQGDLDAATIMCHVYLSGLGKPRDLVAAERWCSQAANAGDALAEFTYGHLIQQLHPDRKEEAQAWLARAEGQGALLFSGDIAPNSVPRCGEANDVNVLIKDGWYAIYGDDGERDIEVADNCLGAAARKGSAVAEYLLAGLQYHLPGDGVADKRAFDLTMAAARKGLSLAEYGVGIYLDDGRIEVQPPQRNEACRWFERAARSGLALAQYEAARCLAERGGEGTNDTARVLFEKAAEAGVPEAKAWLAGHQK